LRLAHLYEVGEHEVLSKPVNLDISLIFNDRFIKISSVTELSLSANRPLKDLKRLKWNSNIKTGDQTTTTNDNSIGSFLVTLSAMEIRTYLLSLF